MRRAVVAAVLLVSGVRPSQSGVIDHTPEHDPVPTRLRATLTGATATIAVQFALEIDEPGYYSGFETLALPTNAVITGGTVTHRGVSHRLELLLAKDADDRFEALANDADLGRNSTATGIRITHDPEAANISLAASVRGTYTLELELSASTCFHNDARYVQVPAKWRSVIEPARRARETSALVDQCAGVETDPWLVFPTTAIAKRRSGDRIGTIGSRLGIGDTHFARVELAVAAHLTDVPRDLATVILVDESRSLSDEELAAQRALVLAYVTAAPESRVQVLAYSRKVRPLLPGWTHASRALARLDRELGALSLRNGSNFDAGLAEAAVWLGRASGTRRVVLFTDERMATRLAEQPPASFKVVLPAGTLVHVVAVDDMTTEFVRDDPDVAALDELATASDGMAVRIGTLPPDKPLDAKMLVRPISFDDITITAPGWKSTDLNTCNDGDDLAEGTSCTFWARGDAIAGPVAIEGMVWGKRVVRLVQPNPGHARSVAREMSLRANTEDEQLAKRIALFARAVNSEWSLFGAWGGTRGFSAGFGFGVISSCCHGGSGTIGHGTPGFIVGGRRTPLDLRPQLAPLVEACGLGNDVASVELEMTELEIADVRVELLDKTVEPARAARVEACVTEALWEAAPMIDRVTRHQTFRLTLGGYPARR